MNTYYSDQAAAQLRQAAERLDEDNTGLTASEEAALRLDIAREYVRLAAIEKGLPPGCACHAGDEGPAKITP